MNMSLHPDKKIITVFLLLYNNQEKIKPALISVAKQNLPDTYEVEVIISDDASPNFDKNEIDEIIKNECLSNINFRWTVIQQPHNLGTVKHANTIIKNSIGSIIIPLGVDDQFYDNNTISKIISHFEKCNTLVATGLREVYDETFKIKLSTEPNRKLRSIISSMNPKLIFDSLIKNGNFISGACTYYKREIFENFGYFDEQYKLLEDYPFYLKLTLNNLSISLIEEPTIKYRNGGISTNKNINPALNKDFNNLLNNLKSIPKLEKSLIQYINFQLYKRNKNKLRIKEKILLIPLILKITIKKILNLLSQYLN